MLLFKDKDGLTKQVTTAGVITFVTETTLSKDADAKANLNQKELGFNSEMVEMLIIEATTKMATYPYVPIRYYVVTDADTIELNSKVQYVHEISVELPLSKKNHKDIEKICNRLVTQLYENEPNLSLCELSLHYRYYYQLDETYNLEGMYDELVLDYALSDDLVDLAFDLNVHTFMLSLADMSKCDTVMRQYMAKHS